VSAERLASAEAPDCLAPLVRDVLACPRCRGSLERAATETLDLRCAACGWLSTTVGGDTVCFVERAYATAQLRTRRGAPSEGAGRASRGVTAAIGARPLAALRRLAARTVFAWRPWLLAKIERRDPAYWRRAFTALREHELEAVERLLDEHAPSLAGEGPPRVGLELGVGFQDHRRLYERLADFWIASDIYRDPEAAALYGASPRSLYALIDAARLPLRESSLDVVFTSHVLEHFPDRRQGLEDLRRALRPGGLACHVVPIAQGFIAGHLLQTALNIVTLSPRLGRGVHGEFESAWQEVRETTAGAWRRLFTSCGYELIAEAPGTLGLYPLRPRLSMWIARRLGLFGSRVFLTRAARR
jgi:SAM-dependent methyltransferase